MLLVSCSTDPNEAANKLFVEAQQLVEKADKLTGKDRLRALVSAKEKLATVIEKYPSSTLAVQLASGQTIGKLSRKDLSNHICRLAPRRACVFEEAREAARSLPEAERAGALAFVAKEQISAGVKGDAEATLLFEEFKGAARSFPERAGALGFVAAQQIRAGLRREAEATLNEAWVLVTQSRFEAKNAPGALSAVAMAHAEAGQHAKVLEITRLLPEAYRNYVTKPVNGFYCKAGRLSEATELAKLLPANEQEYELGRTAVCYADARRFTEAEEIMRTISKPWRDHYLPDIGASQARAGKTGEAKATFNEALAIARALPNDEARAGTLTRIALAQLQANLRTDAEVTLRHALQIAETVTTDENRRTGALSNVAHWFIASDKLVDAMKMAETLPQEWGFRDSVLSAVAKKHMEGGRLQEATAIAEMVRDEEFRMEILTQLAIAKVAADRAVESVAFARSIKIVPQRVVALARIAAALPK
jgi:tetratricopeptide (TPR) repeat protein